MKSLKANIFNEVLLRAPLLYLEKRHHHKTKVAVKSWLNDDFLFLHIPKSGGTSVAHAYQREESGHYSYRELCKLRGDEPTAVYFIMRDPVSRILSSYNYLVGLHRRFGSSPVPMVSKASNINEFLECYLFNIDVNRHYFFKSVCCFIDSSPKERTWMVNFENLNDSLKAFSRDVIGLEMNVPHANPSLKSLTNSNISEVNKRKIRDIYQGDVELSLSLGQKPYMLLAERGNG